MHIVEHGYKQLLSNNSVYFKRSTHGLAILTVTVDDFSVACSSETVYRCVLKELRQKYQAKYLGPIKHILGWSVRRSDPTGDTHLSQPYMAQRFIDVLNMRHGHPSRSPYLSGISLHAVTEQEKILDDKRYPVARAIGILL